MSFVGEAGHRRPAKKLFTAMALTALAVATIPGSGPAQAAPQSTQTDLYLVQVAEAPVASYAGGVAGLSATKPTAGDKVDLDSSSTRAYRGHLANKKNDIRRKTGVSAAQTVQDFDVTFNGFAAKLTEAQAAKLRHTAGVLNVWKNEVRKLDTISTPEFLGLEGRGSLAQAVRRRPRRRRRDRRRHRHRLLAGEPEFRRAARAPAGPGRHRRQVVGTCDAGVDRAGDLQQQGDRRALVQRQRAGGRSRRVPLAARLTTATASHTATTAAGNHGVDAVDQRRVRGHGLGHGARPRASASTRSAGPAVAAAPSTPSNAIDDAVADGVDVINYSISGSLDLVLDPVEVAFFNAAAAGVFVAASAGNSGPGASTVAHNSPWLTTVAASTHDRNVHQVGDARQRHQLQRCRCRPGACASAGWSTAVTAGLAGVRPGRSAELCFLGTLDPAKVTGKIVLCKRGVNARTDKSLAVRDAGGVGMVLYNRPGQLAQRRLPLRPDGARRPSAAGLAIKAYAATAGATASLSAGAATPGRAPNDGRVLVGRARSVGRRRPAQAGHHRARRRRHRRRLPRRATTATSTTPSPARRCRARTSPASRALLIAASTPTGRRCGSSRR